MTALSLLYAAFAECAGQTEAAGCTGISKLMNTPLPLHISLKPLARHGDVLKHEVRVGVVGVGWPAEATIESDFYERPRVTDLRHLGGTALRGRLLDALLVACFELVAGEMQELDGSAADRTISDATSWIERRFSTADAAAVLAALRRQVPPGLHDTDVLTVRID